MIKTTKNSVLYTKSLSKDEFEYVDYSNTTTTNEDNKGSLNIVSNTDDNDIKDIIEFDFLTEEKLKTFFDDNGRVVDEFKLRQAVFNGGCSANIRKKVWSFLFGLYPMMSTHRERKEHFYENYFKYQALKEKCFNLLSHNQFDIVLEESTLDDISKVQFDYHKTSSEIFAEKQEFDLELVSRWFNVIDKDIPRTDVDHPYFQIEKNNRLKEMRNILITFGFFHPSVGYLQVI